MRTPLACIVRVVISPWSSLVADFLKEPMLAMSFILFAVIAAATIAASMAIIDREEIGLRRLRPSVSAEWQATGFFVSRCKGASAPAEKSQATPLREGDHLSVRSGHERKRGSWLCDSKPGKDRVDVACCQVKPLIAFQETEGLCGMHKEGVFRIIPEIDRAAPAPSHRVHHNGGSIEASWSKQSGKGAHHLVCSS